MPQPPHLDVFTEPMTPLLHLIRTLHAFPKRTAVIHGDLRWTYQELALEIGRMAGALQRAGVEEGDRVAVLSPNTPWHLAAHFAMPLLRAPLVSINTRLSGAEIAYILEHSGAKLLLVDPELAPTLDKHLEQIKTLERCIEIPDKGVPVREGQTSYTEFVDGASVLPIKNSVQDENSVISINYTSGTTGRPKGVMYTHRGSYMNALGNMSVLGLKKETVCLWTLPMFHCNGWCMPWAVTGGAGTHLCLRKIDPPEIFSLIKKHGVTHFNAAPTVLLMLSNDPAAKGLHFDPPIRACTGGAPPSPTLLERMENLGINVTHIYGLTETYGPHTLCEIQTEWTALGSKQRAKIMARQGVPYPHAVYLRVVDEKMQDVPRDGQSMGEVVMRGNNVMKGYYNDPEATKKAFRGGWFHSGDMGVMHPDGYIELRDRSKDLIISGGENISTIEVENTIYQHPDVLEVAVVSMPDEKWGEVPKAFVTPKPGTSPTEASIIDFVRERLAHFKSPKAVEFCPLPKTATGKIQKFKLRDKEWAGKEKRIQG